MPGHDQTDSAKLGVFVSPTGAVTLSFNNDNVAKFSEMKLSTEELKLETPAAQLKTQGQASTVGALALKIRLTFKFNGFTCAGDAVAKFGDQTPVRVICN